MLRKFISKLNAVRVPFKLEILKFASSDATENNNKSAIKVTDLPSPCTDILKTTGSSSFTDENETNPNNEASWRTIKYSLMFFLCSFVGAGTYLVLEVGKPDIDNNGKIIADEFSNKPLIMQYISRTLREFEKYNRFIKEPSREKLLPDELKPPYYQPPYTLVLELTDVLVHPEWTYNSGWRFKKRPGINYFLESLSGLYEIVIYTAEQGMTVFPIVEALDPKNLITYKLVRDATHFVHGHHVKNLDMLNRDLNKVIVVDWNMNSVKFHPESVFYIPKWDGNDDDTTLIDLTALLLTIANSEVQDVRNVLSYYNNFDNSLATFREKQKLVFEQQEAQKQSQSNNTVKQLSKSLFINKENFNIRI